MCVVVVLAAIGDRTVGGSTQALHFCVEFDAGNEVVRFCVELDARNEAVCFLG